MDDDKCIDAGTDNHPCEGRVTPKPTWMGSDYRLRCDWHYDRFAGQLWRNFTR